MASPNDQPVVVLPNLALDDGRVDIPEDSTANPIEGEVHARGAGSGADIASVIGQVLEAVYNAIMSRVESDNEGRRQYTQAIVSTLRQTFPQYNWVCVHTAHSKSFEGVAGQDWGQGHGDFDLKIGGVVGYEIYYCRGGIFVLHGDGGFLNWAWTGNISTQSGDGRIVMFRRP
ncbi:hypothetical protein NMY22_g5910 [Coprinellus aureogranulatus]|nr:hypothetical protein NMY22_g5910 [Coprinellus aureogranulatus]